MLRKTMMIASALAGLAIAAPVASAQSGTYWSYDGRTSYTSFKACDDARKTRTIGRTAIGGLVGAGLGTLAGGDDTRNAVVGGIAGAVTGGVTGSNRAQCQQYSASGYGSGYSGSAVQYQQSTPYTYSQGTGYSSGGSSYQTGYPGGQTRYYTTTSPGYSNYGQGSTGYTYTTTQPYQAQQGYTRHYTTQPYQPQHGYTQSYTPQTYTGHTTRTYTRTYTQLPQYQSHAPVTYTQQPGYYPSNAQSNGGYGNQTFWSYDGQSRYQSYESCEQAKRQRTLAGGGLGAVAGAGLGTLAGGDDGRNAVIGAVAGGVLGAYSGNRSIQCSQYTVSNYR